MFWKIGSFLVHAVWDYVIAILLLTNANGFGDIHGRLQVYNFKLQ